MFTRIYYEEDVLKYSLGRELLNKYNNIPQIKIDNHNNIKELREYENKDFTKLKSYLILGTRKTQTFKPNYKVSDYLVPYTSSGCRAMCMYCYLVCHYNKCSYLRIFVNRDELFNKIIKVSRSSDTDLTFEIGSNSDLILENTITHNLEWTICEFGKETKGYLTLPTKFSYVDSLLNLRHNGRTIIRMSLNPEYIISHVELGTSSLDDRIIALNKLCDAGYHVGILIAPVIFVKNWKELYLNLIRYLSKQLSKEVLSTVFFEVIFMTYSFIHNKINSAAFPKSLKIYDESQMIKRGVKYNYNKSLKEDGELFFRTNLKKYFPHNKIVYIC